MKKRKSFTKVLIIIILIVSLIDLQLPFILAFLGRDQIAEDLGKILITEVIGVFFIYCLKSFFETREEENMKYKKEVVRAGDITGNDDAEVVDDGNGDA